MQSRWKDAEARRAISVYRALGAGERMALRTYTTRLLGRDSALVLHGATTSVKTEMPDSAGALHEVVWIKGAGWDLDIVNPTGFAAVKLAPLRELRARDDLSDDSLSRLRRDHLLDPAAPNPPMDMLLHAFLPARYIDHVYAAAVLELLDRPCGAELAREAYGTRLGYVPAHRPGFALANAAAEVLDANPGVEGLLLGKHGIVTFGATARQVYERTIEMVALAVQHLLLR